MSNAIKDAICLIKAWKNGASYEYYWRDCADTLAALALLTETKPGQERPSKEQNK